MVMIHWEITVYPVGIDPIRYIIYDGDVITDTMVRMAMTAPVVLRTASLSYVGDEARKIIVNSKKGLDMADATRYY